MSLTILLPTVSSSGVETASRSIKRLNEEQKKGSKDDTLTHVLRGIALVAAIGAVANVSLEMIDHLKGDD